MMGGFLDKMANVFYVSNVPEDPLISLVNLVEIPEQFASDWIMLFHRRKRLQTQRLESKDFSEKKSLIV